MRALLKDSGFAISVLVAVGVTAFFAFVLDASSELVAAMLVLGLFTALMEHRMRSESRHRRR